MEAADPAPAKSVSAPTLPAGSRSLDGLAVGLAGLAFAAALAARGVLPGWCLPWSAGAALLASCALPLLARLSPKPADPLKLAVFTLALSPLLSACVWAAWHVVLDGQDALAACAATCGAAHLASLRTRVRSAARSRAEFAILALALALALCASFLLLRGNEPRLAPPALTRSAVAMAVDRSMPPLHPWLAGEAWCSVFGADCLAAFFMRALAIAPTLAHALFTVMALLLTPMLVFFIATAIWSDSRRSAISVALALCAGFIALVGTGGYAALEVFLSPGPSALALVLSIAGLASAAHALRHGQRPWTLMCASFHGFALLLEFSSAWPAALALTLTALSPLCDARARPRLLLAIVVCALPGLAQARWLEPVAIAIEPVSMVELALNSLPIVIVSAFGNVFAWRATDRERRVVLVLCAVAAMIALIAAAFGSLWTNQRTAWSLALFSMAIPCAALFPASAPALRPPWWGGAVAALVLGLGGLFTLGERSKPLLAASRRDDPLLGETARALEPISREASAVDLRAALAWIRDDRRLLDDRAVLLACPAHNPYRTTRDLPELALAACAGVPLYGDTRSSLLEREAQFLPRLEELLRLFRHAGDFDPMLFARLQQAQVRAVLALVRDEDRAINPPLAGKLERIGFSRWREFGGVWLYVGPREAALRYVGSR